MFRECKRLCELQGLLSNLGTAMDLIDFLEGHIVVFFLFSVEFSFLLRLLLWTLKT